MGAKQWPGMPGNFVDNMHLDIFQCIMARSNLQDSLIYWREPFIQQVKSCHNSGKH